MEKILEVKGLTKLYKNKRGIRDITFDIYKGDVFGFLGPNGAGKTTAMKAIASLCRADSGEIKVQGYDCMDEYEKAMEGVGCIIENPAAFEYMSGYKNLEMVSRYYEGIDGSRIDEVLETVGLKEFKDEKVSGYSLGMKQRLGLAAAILSNPELVILDEPLNGLDIEGMVEMRKLIKTLSEEKRITFFISSHLIHEVELTCNRIGIIQNGRLLETGLVSDMKKESDSLEEYYLNKIKEVRGYAQ
ncbi:MAG TPA: ATP-binding cassette domain-containing protein [Clostridia bacterium]|nr:ATP-binding cassette domain-containing protein [Clostridia bacterium]